MVQILRTIADTGGRVDLALGQLPRGNPFFLSDVLLGSLERMGAFAAMREAIERSGDGTMLRHFHTWSDAFRTLKLVHALRDGGLPSLPWRQALAEAPFTGLSASTVEAVEPLRKALAVEERRLAETPAGCPRSPAWEPLPLDDPPPSGGEGAIEPASERLQVLDQVLLLGRRQAQRLHRVLVVHDVEEGREPPSW